MEDQQWLTWLGQIQRQAGVVSRQQALDAGFTEKAIEWRLRRGMWQRLHAGAYATFSGKPSQEGSCGQPCCTWDPALYSAMRPLPRSTA